MSLMDRIAASDFNQRTPGTMTTPRQRLRMWMELHRAGMTVSPWMRRCLLAQLPPMAVNGHVR